MSRGLELTGKTFGRLTALKKVGIIKKHAVWECLCTCGKTKVISCGNLSSGHTKSCGCLSAEEVKTRSLKHGDSSSRLYKIWIGIKKRCDNKKSRSFKDYGERGIEICSEWKLSFEAFREWALSNGYTETASINRINNDGNYSLSNCNWVTRKIQGQNKRNNILFSFNGKTQCLSMWAEELGIKYTTLRQRLILYLWPINKAFKTPTKKGRVSV